MYTAGIPFRQEIFNLQEDPFYEKDPGGFGEGACLENPASTVRYPAPSGAGFCGGFRT